MKPRMKQPVFVIPEAMKALQALSASTHDAGVSAQLFELIHLRASQINGCGVCVDMHSRSLKKAKESDERLFSVAAWRDAPYFTDAERAALALTEELTRLADKPEAVSDATWAEATRHFDEKALSAVLLEISTINVWNRLNCATRQVAGQYMR